MDKISQNECFCQTFDYGVKTLAGIYRTLVWSFREIPGTEEPPISGINFVTPDIYGEMAEYSLNTHFSNLQHWFDVKDDFTVEKLATLRNSMSEIDFKQFLEDFKIFCLRILKKLPIESTRLENTDETLITVREAFGFALNDLYHIVTKHQQTMEKDFDINCSMNNLHVSSN